MTERVRTVPSGIVGLDLALGGGPRFVRRTHAADRESATLVIRGGPGAGKSVLAQDLALRLADKLGGDVLYACIEVLPSEVLAQRQGFDGFDAARAVDLSEPTTRKNDAVSGPCLVVGMRDLIAVDEMPDLGQALLDLHRIAAARGFAPKVVVVDSLSDGYALGSRAPRDLVDGVCKLAIEQGWALILVEEATSDPAVSPWCFAVDTVLSLRVVEREGLANRELLVAKHRFAGCEPGPHRLMIEPARVRVIPPLSAYRNAAQVLRFPPPSKNRSLRIPVKEPSVNWDHLAVHDDEGRFVCVSYARNTSQDQDQATAIAYSIGTYDRSGDDHPGGALDFFLYETSSILAPDQADGTVKGTLHQFINGAEWIESALTKIISWRADVLRAFIGPTERLDKYEHQDDLRRAISLVASLLRERGLVVVLLGPGAGPNAPTNVLQGGVATDLATVQLPSSNASKVCKLRFFDGATTFEITPVL